MLAGFTAPWIAVFLFALITVIIQIFVLKIKGKVLKHIIGT